jgi:hypothetical protein
VVYCIACVALDYRGIFRGTNWNSPPFLGTFDDTCLARIEREIYLALSFELLKPLNTFNFSKGVISLFLIILLIFFVFHLIRDEYSIINNLIFLPSFSPSASGHMAAVAAAASERADGVGGHGEQA